jgi:hypothetical protein
MQSPEKGSTLRCNSVQVLRASVLLESRFPARENVMHYWIQVFCPALRVKGIRDFLANRFGRDRPLLSNPVVRSVDFRGCLYGFVVLFALVWLEAFVVYYSRSS